MLSAALLALLATVLLALCFEFINGFHDTANSVATVVATKVLKPYQAILLASLMNLCGALAGTAVAKTIATGILVADVVPIGSGLIASALMAGIVWNLWTWYHGLPSSSSHALIGGLIGAALGASGGSREAVIWSAPAEPWYLSEGVLWKVVLPMFASPLGGFVLGLLLMALLFGGIGALAEAGGWLSRQVRTRNVNAFFGKAQIASASAMAFMHGMNDAQKAMGVIAMTLLAGTAAGTFDALPPMFDFLRLAARPDGQVEIATWLKLLCAVVMAAGTAAGGWRIIRTMGHKMVKLQPIHGFAAETTAGLVIHTASSLGIPLSTTHAISTSIMGVGAMKRFGAVKWGVVERILWAWVLTLPVCGLLGFIAEVACRYFGME